ncbi:OmpA family protein [Halobacillus salinus]|uniref:OmpA family protein n=2 Tax=Halobacillus salinus TaxID=192814 RepID=A0A4Z0H4R5_9BACI|nr:OmpA family protein [Halobacillus salinus]
MSYSDLMSALLLIFALLLMVNMYGNQKEIEAKDKVIEDVIGVKTKLIEELRQTFQDSNLQMEIDPQTGAIRFSNGVFFEYNSSDISKEGRKNLESFVPAYIGILLSEEFRPHISQIIIEGHTDDSGDYLYNLNLSQNRSFAVVNEIMEDDFPEFEYRSELRDIITSNGRSFSEPILNNNGNVDPEKSRRVEFKFRLKDDEVIQKIEELVREDE